MAEDGNKAGIAMQSWRAVKETGFWLLAILGAFALIYVVGYYGELISRIR